MSLEFPLGLVQRKALWSVTRYWAATDENNSGGIVEHRRRLELRSCVMKLVVTQSGKRDITWRMT